VPSELVITHSMFPVGEAKWVNSMPTGASLSDLSSVWVATAVRVCPTDAAKPSGLQSEEPLHPASTVTVTTPATAAQIPACRVLRFASFISVAAFRPVRHRLQADRSTHPALIAD